MVWVLLTLSSAFFFAAKDIIAKKLLRHDTSPQQLFFEEFLLLFVLSTVLFYHLIEFSSFIVHWDIYFLKAISIGVFTIIYLKLLKKYEISHVAPLMNLSPLLLLFLSSFILSEQLAVMQFVGILIIIFSTYLLEITYHHHHKEEPHKHHWINLRNKDKRFYILSIVMLVSISFAAIYDKKIFNAGLNVYSNMFFTGLIIFLFSIVYYIYEGHLKRTLENIIEEPETLVVGLFHNVSTLLILYAISIPTAMVSLIVPLKRTSTLLSSLFGGLMFHEKHLKKKMFATFGMVLGIFLIVL